MNIKRFLVKDMQEAMVKIRSQLGSDAVILSNRPVRKKGLSGLFSKPLIEVMVAYETEPKNGTAKSLKSDANPPAAAQTPAHATTQAPDPMQAHASAQTPAQPNTSHEHEQPMQNDKLTEMEKKMESMTVAVQDIANKIHSNSAVQRYCTTIQQQFIRLLDNEVDEGVARALADEAQEIANRRKVDPADAFEQVVRHHLGVPEGIKLQRFKRTVAVFIGPTGAGKTTTIAKLAAKYAIHEQAKVGLITADAYRIAAHEQIKTYSDILEVPLKTIYKPEDITQALIELENTDIVLVDTPGKSPNDKLHQAEIATIIEKSGASEVFLVLSAATGYKSSMMVAEQYRFVKDFKVILTKVDETISCGMHLNARALTGKPLSYVTTGQSVPDDIELFDVTAATAQLLWKVE